MNKSKQARNNDMKAQGDMNKVYLSTGHGLGKLIDFISREIFKESSPACRYIQAERRKERGKRQFVSDQDI